MNVCPKLPKILLKVCRAALHLGKHEQKLLAYSVLLTSLSHHLDSLKRHAQHSPAGLSVVSWLMRVSISESAQAKGVTYLGQVECWLQYCVHWRRGSNRLALSSVRGSVPPYPAT